VAVAEVQFDFRSQLPPAVYVVVDADEDWGQGRTRAPGKLAELVRKVRSSPAWHPMPVVFNEDPNLEMGEEKSTFLAAVGAYASWGLYDQGKNDYKTGFQSPPVDWSISTDAKRAFFRTVAEVTGSE
jgi:hypothetical protein